MRRAGSQPILPLAGRTACPTGGWGVLLFCLFCAELRGH
jgi:hypothetical protein